MVKPDITVYGAPWCPDCKHSKQSLGEQRIPYKWVQIEENKEARQYRQRVNNSKWSESDGTRFETGITTVGSIGDSRGRSGPGPGMEPASE